MATDDVDGLHRIAIKLFDLFHIGIHSYFVTLSQRGVSNMYACSIAWL